LGVLIDFKTLLSLARILFIFSAR